MIHLEKEKLSPHLLQVRQRPAGSHCKNGDSGWI